MHFYSRKICDCHLQLCWTWLKLHVDVLGWALKNETNAPVIDRKQIETCGFHHLKVHLKGYLLSTKWILRLNLPWNGECLKNEKLGPLAHATGAIEKIEAKFLKLFSHNLLIWFYVSWKFQMRKWSKSWELGAQIWCCFVGNFDFAPKMQGWQKNMPFHTLQQQGNTAIFLSPHAFSV